MSKKNKKIFSFNVKDMSLAGQLTSHIKDFRTTKEGSNVLYSGSPDKPRFEGNISDKGIFRLFHYGTPIMEVEKKEAKILDLPANRKGGYSGGDLTAINTVFNVLGLCKRVLKRQGTLYTVKWEPVEL